MESKITLGNPPKEHKMNNLNTIEEAIEDIKLGKVVIVVDDEDRENEGDFICAASKVTPEIINFMATHGRGLICAAITEKRADRLGLEMMVPTNTGLHETAFTVSIDLIGKGCSTGISAYDRSTCIQALVDENTIASDFAKPGHIFPLRAKEGGVLRRSGHTEAAIDLAKLAGFPPAGALVEILNEDGTMARLPQLEILAKKMDLKLISIKDLIEYRLQKEQLIEKLDEYQFISEKGDFNVHVFEQKTTGDKHLAIKIGHWKSSDPVMVRVHSRNETSDILGFLMGTQNSTLHSALDKIQSHGAGLIVYMRHQSKDDALIHYLSTGLKAKPNKESAQRDFGIGAQILRKMGVKKIKLLSNSPKKHVGLVGYGLEIVENLEI